MEELKKRGNPNLQKGKPNPYRQPKVHRIDSVAELILREGSRTRVYKDANGNEIPKKLLTHIVEKLYEKADNGEKWAIEIIFKALLSQKEAEKPKGKKIKTIEKYGQDTTVQGD